MDNYIVWSSRMGVWVHPTRFQDCLQSLVSSGCLFHCGTAQTEVIDERHRPLMLSSTGLRSGLADI